METETETSAPKLLPPIEMVLPPKTTTKSALIRWYFGVGYKVAEIANYLGIRYQMVRNITTTVPKRAAREDLPPLVIEMRGEVDDVQAISDHELDRALLAGRKTRKAAAKDQRRADWALRAEEDEEGEGDYDGR